ncbi:MAG: hypothetical protein LBH04_08545 [Tannerellaceae bacterium]|jgi:hypothetical protein|nr:hypothetical protein [Tannerellaceae bacterium]
MKRILSITVSIWIALSLSTNAQSPVRPYIQLNVGTDPVTNGGGAWTIKPEIGWDFKFINVNLLGVLTTNMLFSNNYSILHLSDEPPTTKERTYINGRTAHSVMLNAGIDAIKIFTPQSAHGIILSIGSGITQVQKQKILQGTADEFISSDFSFGLDFGLSASYQYQIADEWRIGLYTDIQSMIEYATFGIALKRYF